MAKLRRFIKPVLPGIDEPPVWFYIGERSDHVVVPSLFCTCKHFIIRTMCERVERYCNHILAQRIAWAKKWYREINVTRYELYIIIEEIIEHGRSRMLRKKIYSGRL